MSITEFEPDLQRILESAAADVGDAVALRRRAASDANLRHSLSQLVEAGDGGVEPSPEQAERRATALFLLGKDDSMAPFARRADAYRVKHLWALAESYQDHPALAAEILTTCLEAEPRDERVRLQLVAALARVGRGDEAHEALGDLAGQEDRADVLFALGAIAEAQGNYDEATDRYQAAVGHDPENVDALFRLAYYYDLHGDDEAATALYERARRLKPTRTNVLLNLGILYEDREEFEQAAACYRQILTAFPNHTRAKAFLADAESSKSMVLDEDMERNEDRRNQLLRTPISDFELSVRSRNCLAKMNIITLGDLIQRSEAELLAYKNFGETSLQEIKDILTTKALRLGMRREEVQVAGVNEALLPEVPQGADPGLLALPVADLGMSIRSRKCMEALGIQTVSDLVSHSEQDLLRSRNFGQTSMLEIKQKLAEMGLGLKK